MEKIKNANWYIVRTQGNHEKSLAEKLKNDKSLERHIGQVLVPTEISFYLKNKKKVKREKVIYPGYVFVETNNTGEVSEFLKQTSSGGFLKERNGDIKPMRKREVENLIGQIDQKQEEDLSSNYIVGEEVRIMDGPFATMVGTITNITDEKLSLNVSIFGRETKMDVNVLQVEKK
jgi:transcriptional antiterminator NusG